MDKNKIIQKIGEFIPAEFLVSDEKECQAASADRFRRFETIHGVYTQPAPAVIIKAQSTDQVSQVLAFANQNSLNVVPRTGRTATEGGLETRVQNSLVLDGSGMNKVLKIDPFNMQATVQCGVVLGDLEQQLRKQGLTTGHSPQSQPLAQFGGLLATRSIGQFSTLYGGIEDMVVGLEAVFPDGHIARIKDVPRRAAGPDIRQVVIGNEGTLCFITEVTIKLFPYFPENHQFLGAIIDEMKPGFEVLRQVMIQGFKPSIARLYDWDDASQHSHFQFLPKGKCLLLFLAEGPAGIAKATAQAIQEIINKTKNTSPVDPQVIQTWFEQLNWGQSKIDEEYRGIKETGIIGHTTEVAATWDRIHSIYESCIARVKAEHERYADFLQLGGHSSHSYINGTNIYFIYNYQTRDIKPEEEIDVYHNRINDIICDETIKQGGSMVHHHGIGKGRARFAAREHDSAYYMLEKLKGAFDPNGILNRGTIFDK